MKYSTIVAKAGDDERDDGVQRAEIEVACRR
jgi:hypothetical protein